MAGPRQFRALRFRNYRLFFFGQLVSLIGTWMTTVATAWLVYRLSGSAALLGLVAFSSQIPAFLIAPVAGVLVDRWNRRRVLIVTQALAMLQSFALAALAISGAITVPHILVLCILQGLINAFDIPARQAFVMDVVDDPSDLANAIALNSTVFNGARLIGPAIAGVLVAWVGEGSCFVIDGVSYLAVIVALAAMRLAARPQPVHSRSVARDLRDGLKYISQFPPIRALLQLVALVSLLGIPYGVLMPVFAREILHGGPGTLGLLMASSGLGATVGALYLASRRTVLGLGRVIVFMTALFGVSLVAFACSRNLWLSVALMAVGGFGMLVQMAASNTIIQTIVDEDKRGRVMSFYAMAFMGMAPFGSLLAGSLASRIGAPRTLMIGGVGCLGAAALFAAQLPELREFIRPIYIKKGILPQVATGLEAATQLLRPPEEG